MKHVVISTYFLFIRPKPIWYRSIYPINISAEPFAIAIVVYLNSTQVYTCDGVIVHRIPTNDTFKCKHALIPTYRLFVQSEYDTVPYIQSTSAPSHLPLTLSCICIARKWALVMVHIPTYRLFVQSQHDTPFHIYNQRQHQSRAICHCHCRVFE